MTLLAGLALIAPPVPVFAGSIMVDVCGEPGVRVPLPVKIPVPGKSHDCCKKGCHAANERKKRVTGETDDFGDCDDCC
ncbi:hypothetical protein [Sphingorhabdus sp.]|uniref:hypothetical protein n=1 Tax=Sphingorhabdus sp. TaxID=1902408 RepID=UPI00391CD876